MDDWGFQNFLFLILIKQHIYKIKTIILIDMTDDGSDTVDKGKKFYVQFW